MEETPRGVGGLEQRVSKDVSVCKAGRRRLLRLGASTGPIILALPGRSALGQTIACASPSFIGSGNLSPGHAPPASCTVGRSPGYWKVCQHLKDWRSPAIAPTFSSCTSGMPNPALQTSVGSTFGQLAPFSSVGGTLAPYGAWRIMAYPSTVDKELDAFNMTQVQLARHLIASYLNLLYFGSGFPLTQQQITAMWTAGASGQLYCPTSCAPGQGWTAEQTICYLRKYTMDAASVSSDTISIVCPP